VLRSNQWQVSEFECLSSGSSEQAFELTVADPWIPANEIVGSQDRRLLGVQVAVFDPWLQEKGGTHK
jgi:hypothetical protein